MRVIAPFLYLTSVVTAQQAWNGWENINKAFVFGASYAANGFDVRGVQPNAAAGNPFGNPPGNGYTSSDGPNVFEYLTTVYNQSLISTYDFAVNGAVIDGALYGNPNNDFVAQMNTKFLSLYSIQEAAGWTSAHTLFTVFFAINDALRSYSRSDNPIETMFTTYTRLVEELYQSGARNFLFLNIPPVNRAPLLTSVGPSATGPLAAFIASFNGRLTSLAYKLNSTHPDTKVFVFDTHALFDQVLDDPSSLPQTATIKNTAGFCPAYKDAPAMDYFNPKCGLPVNEYFWLDQLHPTWPVHDALAAEIAKQLTA